MTRSLMVFICPKYFLLAASLDFKIVHVCQFYCKKMTAFSSELQLLMTSCYLRLSQSACFLEWKCLLFGMPISFVLFSFYYYYWTFMTISVTGFRINFKLSFFTGETICRIQIRGNGIVLTTQWLRSLRWQMPHWRLSASEENTRLKSTTAVSCIMSK